MKLFLSIFTILILAQPAYAAIEIKGLAGFTIIDPISMNTQLEATGIKQTFVSGIAGLELQYRIPVLGLGLGARYDWQGVKVNAANSNSSNEIDIGVSRVSAVASFHLIDTGFYFGPIATLGISHSPNIRHKYSGIEPKYVKGEGKSASLGADLGFKIGPIGIGGEAGFQSYLVTDLETAEGTKANYDLNLGGFYLLGTVTLIF